MAFLSGDIKAYSWRSTVFEHHIYKLTVNILREKLDADQCWFQAHLTCTKHTVFLFRILRNLKHCDENYWRQWKKNQLVYSKSSLKSKRKIFKVTFKWQYFNVFSSSGHFNFEDLVQQSLRILEKSNKKIDAWKSFRLFKGLPLSFTIRKSLLFSDTEYIFFNVSKNIVQGDINLCSP